MGSPFESISQYLTNRFVGTHIWTCRHPRNYVYRSADKPCIHKYVFHNYLLPPGRVAKMESQPPCDFIVNYFLPSLSLPPDRSFACPHVFTMQRTYIIHHYMSLLCKINIFTS